MMLGIIWQVNIIIHVISYDNSLTVQIYCNIILKCKTWYTCKLENLHWKHCNIDISNKLKSERNLLNVALMPIRIVLGFESYYNK